MRAATSLSLLAALLLAGPLCAPRAAAEASPEASPEGSPSVEELQALLAERDAAIIALQNTVRIMMARLESVERAVGAELEAPSVAVAPSSATEEPAASTAHSQKEPGRLVVDALAAERALERTLTQRGALLLPSGMLEVSPTLGYSLNDYDVSVAAEVERSVLTADVDVRIGMPFDTQLELGVPYRWADEDVQPRVPGSALPDASSLDGSGLGGVRVGLAKTVFRERGWRPDLVGRFTWNTGSGDLTDGGVLIGDFESIEASLTFIKRQDPIVFVGSLGYENFYSEQGLKPGDQFSFSVGAALAVSPSSSFFTSVSNQFLDETRFDGEDIDGSDVTAVTLNLGASSVVARGVLLSLVAGIGVSDDAPDYAIGLSGTIRSNLLRNLRY